MALLGVPSVRAGLGGGRSHRVPARADVAPVVVSLWAAAVPTPTLSPHQGLVSRDSPGPGRGNSLDASVGPVRRGCSPGGPRGRTRHRHRRRRLQRVRPRLGADGAGHPAAERHPGDASQPGLRPHRRHARRRPRPHADHPRAAGRPGHGVHRRDLAAPTVLPGPRPARDRPVRPEQRRPAQPRRPRRVPGARPDPGGELVVPRRRLPHRVRRQVPQRLRPPRRPPHRVDALGRPDPRRLRLRGLLDDR